jgi:hypothetical protein
MTELIFPECMVITADRLDDPRLDESYMICKECKTKLDHETKHIWQQNWEWVPEFSDRDSQGFHVNQLYSTTVTPKEIGLKFLQAQIDPAAEQEFWNSKMGLPHATEGARVTDADLNRCKEHSSYKTSDPPPKGIITMGIDVGKLLHYEIDQWFLPGNFQGSIDLNVQSKVKVVTFGTVKNFEDLDRLMREYRVMAAVIDAQPEHRKAYEFASRFWGHVKLCIYGMGISGKQIVVGRDDHGQIVDEHLITVDRTSWLDLSLGRFRTPGMLILPMDVTEEYRQHIKAQVRIYENDKYGNPVGVYVKGEQKPDHFAHARNYSELALPFATSLRKVQDIVGAT